MTAPIYVVILYFAAISVITAVVTCLDKHFAKRSMRRVPEKTLLLLAFLGGSPAEYLTMKLIRHKTQHKKFMLGLPLMMLLQIVFIFALIYIKGM